MLFVLGDFCFVFLARGPASGGHNLFTQKVLIGKDKGGLRSAYTLICRMVQGVSRIVPMNEGRFSFICLLCWFLGVICIQCYQKCDDVVG